MKKSFSLILSLIMLLSAVTALPFSAHASANYTWEFDSSRNTLTIKAAGAGKIDSTDFDAYVDDIKFVYIEEGIHSIDNEIFNNFSNIKYVSIPSSCTSIGASAFSNCSALETFVMKDGLETIGNKAFWRCSNLESMYFPSSLVSIGDEAFHHCSSLYRADFKEGLKSIGARAFMHTAIANVAIPASVNSIGVKAFGYSDDSSRLVNFRIASPSNSGLAKDYAEDIGCMYYNLYNIVENDGFGGKDSFVFNTKTGTLTISNTGGELYLESGKNYDAYSAFSLIYAYRDNIKKVVLNNVKGIGDSAFAFFDQLSEVELCDGLEIIYYGAFFCTPKLKSVTIPNSVTYIGSDAFGVQETTFDGYQTFCVMPNFTIIAACNNPVVKQYIDDTHSYYSSINNNKIIWKKTHSYKSKITATTNKTYTRTYTCSACNAAYKKTFNKTANTLTAKGKTKTLKAKNLKKKAKTFKRKDIITVSKPKGTVTYAKASGNKKIVVNKKTGNVTVKKGLKKGTYKVKVKVTAKGTTTYKTKTVTATVIIKVK